MEEGMQRIKEAIGNGIKLTPSQLKVANSIIENPQKFLMLGVEEISSKTEVSIATVSRFVKAVGFNEFSEFQNYLKANVLDDMNNSYDFLYSAGNEHPSEVSALAKTELECFGKNFNKNIESEITKISELVVKSEKVYLVGFGLSKIHVDFLSYKLKRLGITIQVLDRAGKEVIEEILYLNKKDLVILFGFNGSFPELELVQKYAVKKGGKNIVFVENQCSKLISQADGIINFQRGAIGTFRSLAYPMFLLNVLVSKVSSLNEETKEQLKNDLDWLKVTYKNIKQGK